MSMDDRGAERAGAEFLEAEQKEADAIDQKETLSRMLDETGYIRQADQDVKTEMTKPVRIICDPPPVTPMCHGVDDPPNPYVVDRAVAKVQKFASALKSDADSLKGSEKAPSGKLGTGIAELNSEIAELEAGARKLSGMTSNPDGDYDREKVAAQSDKVTATTNEIDVTVNKLKQDVASRVRK